MLSGKTGSNGSLNGTVSSQAVSEGHKNAFVLDLDACISDIGKKNFYSPKMWYMGSMLYSKAGMEAIIDEIGLSTKAAFEPRKKIAVVDIDNTLWRGVDGIDLSSHNRGVRYYDFQKRLLEMKQHGACLA